MFKHFVLRRLERIEAKLDKLLEQLLRIEGIVSAELDRVKTAVTALTTVTASAVTLLGDLAALVRANATDPAELNRIADEIDARKAELAAAITQNTPG